MERKESHDRLRKIRKDFNEMTSGNQKIIEDIESIKSSLRQMVMLKRKIDSVHSVSRRSGVSSKRN